MVPLISPVPPPVLRDSPNGSPLIAKTKALFSSIFAKPPFAVMKKLFTIPYQEYITSSHPPNALLAKIEATATQGIKNAQNIQTPLHESVAPELHHAINGAIASLEMQRKTEEEKAKRVGEIAQTLHGEDENITRPISFNDQAAQEKLNARTFIPQQKKELLQIGTIYVAFHQMLLWSGLKEESNNDFLQVVQEGVQRKALPNGSIWDVFVRKYQPNWMQKIKAATVYWLFYKTSLLEKGLKTYSAIFLDSFDPETIVALLADPNKKTLNQFFLKVLENTDDFLSADVQAAKDFAARVGTGKLEARRTAAIESTYQSIEDLCKKFSQSIIKSSSPRIPIFENGQKIRWIGFVFQKFEIFVNRCIIQKIMGFFILPKIFKTLFNEGVKFTSNLSFKINITRFLIQQLDKLKQAVEAKDVPSGRSSKLCLGEDLRKKLSRTVEKLILSIELEPFDTPEALQAKLKELEESPPLRDLHRMWSHYFDKEVTKSVQASITESLHLFFDYLHHSAQSGELFSQFLKICIESFKPKNQDGLEDQYVEEREELERKATDVFEKIIFKTVSEKFEGPNPQSSEELSRRSFQHQAIILKEGTRALKAIGDAIQTKVESGPDSPRDIQPEIVSSLEVLTALATRKEFNTELDKVRTRDKKAVWDEVTPIFDKMDAIQQNVMHLQKLFYNYFSNFEIFRAYQAIQQFFHEETERLIHSPRHFEATISSLAQPLERIKRRFGEESPAYKKGTALLARTDGHLASLIKVQVHIDALDGFRNIARKFITSKKEAQYGFKPKRCILQMVNHLKFLPEQDQGALQNLMGENGIDLLNNDQAIDVLMDRLKQTYLDQKMASIEPLQQVIEEIKNWASFLIEKYNYLKQEDYKKLKSATASLVVQIGALESKTRTIHFNSSAHFTQSEKEFIASASYGVGVIGGLSSYLSPPVAMMMGGAIKYLQGLNGPSMSLLPFLKTLGAAGVMNYFLPVTLPMSALYVGKTSIEGVKSYFENQIQKKVLSMFKSAYSLALKNRIYKATLSRIMLYRS